MELLRYVSGLSGGIALEADDASTLPGILDLETITRERKGTIEFRSSPLLLMAMIVLLSVEWLLRKIWGLV
jgi:hypothetical protein